MAKRQHVEQNNFELAKLRFSEKGLETTFKVTVREKDHTNEILYNVNSPIPPHPDLLAFKNKFREYLMRSVGLYRLHDIAMKYLKGEKADKVAQEFGDMVYETEVISLSMSGQDQLKGLIISGKMKNLMEGNTAINSPRVVFSSDKMGFESLVEDLWLALEEEAYAYLYQNKKAQLDLFEEVPEEASA